MKNIVSLLLIIFLAICCTACGDKYVSVMKYDNTTQIPQTAKFAVVEVDNKALFISEAKDLDIKTELKKAINEELTKQNLFGNDLIIKSTILDYRAGNAFKRWLMPGYGTTKLTVESKVYNKENKLISNIPAEANISMGGAYSIGAYKTIFKDVAKLTVNAIQTELLGIKVKTKNKSQ